VLHTWRLTLEYDGTQYSGWQEQTNAKTVAGEVRQAAGEFLQTDVELHGSGRTDAGVHALAQIAHLRANVRRVVGALVKIGKGEMTVAQFEQLLNGKCDSKLDIASWTAPAAGLFLEQVTYNE
jgi:tRNA U38,U39,U40 pseudouridine synthase TruA